jgi:hypothetical protein
VDRSHSSHFSPLHFYPKTTSPSASSSDLAATPSLQQAWTTTNLLRTQVELENQIAKGLKLDLATALNPAKSQKSAIVTAIYKQPSLHTRATVDLFRVRVGLGTRGGASPHVWTEDN